MYNEIKKLSIGELVPDNKNFNNGTDQGKQALMKSLQKFGPGRSVVVDKNLRLIGGNKVTEAAKELGFDEVIVVPTDGKTLVVVQRPDIDLDSKEGREMALADNQTAALSLNWDEEALLSEFDADFLSKEWGLDFDTEEELDAEEDEGAPGIPDHPVSVIGDLYELHSLHNNIVHRIQCGDSTESDVVEKTMNGGFAILMVTDPPYGVEYDPAWRNEAAENGSISYAAVSVGKVQNDDKVNWTEAWSLFGGNVCYVWHADRHAAEVQNSLEDCGFVAISQIIWAKPVFAISRGDYHWQHEPCWYMHRKGKIHNWQGSRNESTLWQIGRSDMDTGHGTQKPMECMARPIRNNTSKGESVYDPFLGSGTTLIACEQLQRNCYGQELDEKYMDIIVKRWVNYMQQNEREYKVLRNGEDISGQDWITE